MVDIEDLYGKILDVTSPDNDDNTKDNKQPDIQIGVDLIQAASETIMKDNRFLTIEETKEMLYYKNGVYLLGAETLIEKAAEKIFGYAIKNKHLSEIKGHIMRRTYHKREEIDADINIINLKNGIYDIEKDVLKEHTPDYLSINQKPIIYDKKARPKLFGKFLSEVLYARDIRTAVDSMAYSFYRDYIIEVIFILLGYGLNGKTVFTSIMTCLHGRNNISNVPLSEILGNRFALSDLENKDVNIDNELPVSTIKEAAVLKRLTGGSRQPIRIERKNQRAYDTVLYAKLFFNANKMPDSDDTSDAYNRRLILTSFPHRFDGKREDKQLTSKLKTEKEMSGIFNVLMIALRRILHNKEIYVNEKTIEEKRVKYERTVNPVKAFIEEAVAQDSTDSDSVTKEKFYDAYQRFCKKYSLPIEKIESFGRVLRGKIGFRDGRQSTGERKTIWIGVRLTGEYTLEIEQTTIV